MTVNVTGISIVVGMLSGQETFSTQAFGAGDLPRMGVVLQRALFVGGCACVPVF